MKFAVLTPCDQTIVYLADGVMWTIDHKKARLFDSRIEAVIAIAAVSVAEGETLTVEDAGPHAQADVVIETVEDEAEFRAREDTW